MRMTRDHVDALTLNYAGVHVFQSTFIDRVGFIGAFYFYFFFFLFLSVFSSHPTCLDTFSAAIALYSALFDHLICVHSYSANNTTAPFRSTLDNTFELTFDYFLFFFSCSSPISRTFGASLVKLNSAYSRRVRCCEGKDDRMDIRDEQSFRNNQLGFIEIIVLKH